MCGENAYASGQVDTVTRITPACAGKTYCGLQPVRLPEDHPRVCGENITSKTYNVRTRGSPPRVRGKHGTIKETEVKSRITPACAGKTEGGSFSSSPKKDHPRVCGENEGRHACQVFWIGSPPRVRGKRFSCSCSLFAVGITPACAGKTNRGKRLPLFPQDHPRVCGENF